jgi:hypothetical protein
MKIAILETLETQQQWQDFSARKIPYAYVLNPLSLIDFQSTFIQLTDIDKNLRDGRQATKYSIGSRKSAQAAWALIEKCEWSLIQLFKQLKVLDFSSNVRDNSVLDIHGDLTVRQFFAKEKCAISPWLLQHLTPLTHTPKRWYLNDIKRLLSSDQISNITWLDDRPQMRSIKAILNALISYPQGWQIDTDNNLITLLYKRSPIVSFSALITALPATKKQLQIL